MTYEQKTMTSDNEDDCIKKLKLIAYGDLEWCVDEHTLRPMLFDSNTNSLTPASEQLTYWYQFIQEQTAAFLRKDENKKFWKEVEVRHVT